LNRYYINKEWMLSVTARRVYRAAAILSLTLVPTLTWFIYLENYPDTSSTLLLVVRRIVLAGILGTATTTIAMEYFIFGFDDSSGWKKTFWFTLIFLPAIGAPLYCLIVYSRSNVLKPYWKTRAEEKRLRQEQPLYRASSNRSA
jgi:hypothetical protein